MDYDVVVVGAGPSGSTAARECAKRGLKTLLLEKEVLPRYKACGGGVTQKAEKALGFKLPDDIIHREVREFRMYYGGGYLKHESSDKLVSMTDRGEFDSYLVEKAVEEGVELRDNAPVTEVNNMGGYCIVKTCDNEFKTPIVVGGDGVRSIVAERVRPFYRPDEVILAYETEIPLKKSIIDERGHLAETHLDCECMGYGWVFPKREHLSVGMGGVMNRFKNSRIVFERYVQQLDLDLGDSRVHAHMIPIGNDKRKTVSDRTILVGDAAGFVEPFTGEGIYYAILSGRLATDTIVHAYERNEFSEETLREYEEECIKEFCDEFRRGLKAMKAFFMLRPLSVRILFSDNAFVEHFARIQTGEETYKEFKKWVLPRVPYFLIKSLLPQ
ncbi:MAG: geranylgeranyl reductase family protein [Candidatus Altiarchaeota archaeon]